MSEDLHTEPIGTYNGGSMRPVLKPGDGLIVQPYRLEDPVRRGDVVLFRFPENDLKVVHRVVAVGAHGNIRTRGDGNSGIDPWILKKEDIEGRVVQVVRGRRTIKVPGGGRGRIQGVWARWLKRMDSGLRRWLHRPYRAVSLLGFRRALPRTFMNIRKVRFNKGNGVEIHLFWGGMLIGRRPAGRAAWQIKRPFKLLVDEQTLSIESPPPRKANDFDTKQ